MITPPPLPKEPFDPSPSSRTGEVTPEPRSTKAVVLKHGAISVGTLGVLYAVALLVKAIKPSWSGAIDGVLQFLNLQ